MDEVWNDDGLRFEAVDHEWCRVLLFDGVLDMAVLGSQESQLAKLVADAPGLGVSPWPCQSCAEALRRCAGRGRTRARAPRV